MPPEDLPFLDSGRRRRRTVLRAANLLPRPSDSVALVGDRIAEFIARGNRIVPAALENDMIRALNDDSHYGSYTGTTYYNGITEKEPEWNVPVIPSQI